MTIHTILTPDGYIEVHSNDGSVVGKFQSLREQNKMANKTVEYFSDGGVLTEITPGPESFGGTDYPVDLSEHEPVQLRKSVPLNVIDDSPHSDSHAEMINSGQSVPGGFASQVSKIVSERESQYGSPAGQHQLTADFWSSWLSKRLGLSVRLSAEDVCLLNAMQKVSRLAIGTKDDSLLDIAGFIENVAQLRPGQRNYPKSPK